LPSDDAITGCPSGKTSLVAWVLLSNLKQNPQYLKSSGADPSSRGGSLGAGKTVLCSSQDGTSWGMEHSSGYINQRAGLGPNSNRGGRGASKEKVSLSRQVRGRAFMRTWVWPAWSRSLAVCGRLRETAGPASRPNGAPRRVPPTRSRGRSTGRESQEGRAEKFPPLPAPGTSSPQP
jgi:hypothetical protein